MWRGWLPLAPKEFFRVHRLPGGLSAFRRGLLGSDRELGPLLMSPDLGPEDAVVVNVLRAHVFGQQVEQVVHELDLGPWDCDEARCRARCL